MTSSERIELDDAVSQIVDNIYENNEDDDLERTLVLAAANADQRITPEWQVSKSIEQRNSSDENDDRSKEIFDTVPKKKIRSSENPIKFFSSNETIKSTSSSSQQGTGEHSNIVAQHYNELEEKGYYERAQSRIFFMRNFNNWIKSMLINQYLTKIRDSKSYGSPIRVLDMCCGKGGDLLKWRKGNITHLICADIATVSVEQCESRYRDMINRDRGGRSPIFTSEFISADLSKIRIREKFKDPSVDLDLVSCQFSFHYSFESLQQAECMFKNASECLRPGGYFIGTMPNANELMARQRKAHSKSFGNDIYGVTFHCDTDKPPLFGAKYDFQLEGVVNCPEFLVHFPTFEKLATRFGLKLVKQKSFYDFYNEVRDEGHSLMNKMMSLEVYPPQQSHLVGTASDDYKHAEDYIKKYNFHSPIGTLSKSEWEATTLYLIFAFEKLKKTWNADGKPEYIIN